MNARPTRRTVLSALGALPFVPGVAQAQPTGRPARTEVLAQGLSQPWALAFLPDGRWLVTEKAGRLRIVRPDGPVSARVGEPVAGLPAVEAIGQGGLLDVVPATDFGRSRRVFWAYAEAGSGDERGRNGTAVARGRLVEAGGGARLEEVQVVFRQRPKVASRNHFGCRLVFDRGGMLFVTLGDRFGPRDQAQALDGHLGKIVRIAPDGEVPKDNPFVGRPGALPDLWSYGHRNIQGAALHPATGELWITEHGPQGGDELNRVQRGGNHGWPVITHGREYGSGLPIGDGTERADVVAPLRVWRPTSIAPSGLAFVTGDRYPGWKGNLVLGALRDQSLWRLQLDGERIAAEERLAVDARVRDVREGPDGALYLLTDESDGKVLRLLG
ncbi:PQQ-dependent sugar dehydrogenase [Aquabacterium sp. J223]|uniref:PQQ-dependent sugar dehydrogenase n=1 Tax=Aquabacterium sp. J223 TaxID=2898431 RepID=UPI0021ADA039|nr:PQQ-dependent sugar dehydrogenase [Aquabacterium sp. J223]UUX95152.1 PQQ-dependent sugar dehydrogenase [Aquabacterium sp. J223]